ncbi:asp2-like accessory secretory protein [Limosilactobacillus equigenerosi DSM 18793 = JCM 14505]|uniref:Asp2-like accessory secretory protein n=1 Tax=Limosilactobacillus equigenerosi DSM 18793 = JCM 14505 TaxID=1423742 RepID=A0A0R1UFV3_9LACO|nr:asp2-like accessory secretory protein [Limosilactobacillus equigenerosi DSM 18793 = JCM 14505]
MLSSENSDANQRFRLFHGVVINDWPDKDELLFLMSYVDAYRVIMTKSAEVNYKYDDVKYFMKARQVRRVDLSLSESVDWVEKYLFEHQIGSKLDISTLELTPKFNGAIEYHGFDYVNLNGNFGDDYEPLYSYRWGIHLDPNRGLDLWAELTKDITVNIRMVAYEMTVGNPFDVRRRFVINEDDLLKGVTLSDLVPNGTLNITIEAKGFGQLKVGAFHYRWSRFGIGAYLPGGIQISDSNREELSFLFNPGDLKPPLNVYFSGYRMAEGFEGYYMMRSMKAPFILIADPRLEGGAFYFGSKELENKLISKIQEKLDWLGFNDNQLIFSGSSMGTVGAFYYGSKFKPHSIIVGKPILHVGTIAKNESANRFGTFPTSLDVLQKHSNNDLLIDDQIKTLNQRVVNQLFKHDLSETSLYMGYMKDDDYDNLVNSALIGDEGNDINFKRIVRYGIPGRHNDDSLGLISKWMKRQFRRILADDFERG